MSVRFLTRRQSFESFSEDPHLSGTICASYVKGIQDNGIGCTIKHFVCNDQENDRMGYDVIVSPRALRELYLMPFMVCSSFRTFSRLMAISRSRNATPSRGLT